LFIRIQEGRSHQGYFRRKLEISNHGGRFNGAFQPLDWQRIHIVTDRETGRARGFAFVEIPNDAEAAKAIAGPVLVAVAADYRTKTAGSPPARKLSW
jgi:hypothetical protein